MVGSVDFGWYPILGSFALRSRADTASSQIGVWLWRPSSADITPPTITPTLSGTLGNNGWYVSNIGLTWAVSDPESAMSARSGCGPRTIAADTVATNPDLFSHVHGRDGERVGRRAAGHRRTVGLVPVAGARLQHLHGPAAGRRQRVGRDLRSGLADRRGLR